MASRKKALLNEAAVISKQVKDLYAEYFAKMSEILNNDTSHAKISIIEELTKNLENEKHVLESIFLKKCRKILLNK
jgi:hypothetical protein